jgi:hypothetical protein
VYTTLKKTKCVYFGSHDKLVKVRCRKEDLLGYANGVAVYKKVELTQREYDKAVGSYSQAASA